MKSCWHVLFGLLALGAAAQDVPTVPTESVPSSKPRQDEKTKPGEPQVIRSKVDDKVFYYVEKPKFSRAQLKAWDKKCKRKYKVVRDQEKCFDRLKQKYLESQDE